jgi:hypothetical protein
MNSFLQVDLLKFDNINNNRFIQVLARQGGQQQKIHYLQAVGLDLPPPVPVMPALFEHLVSPDVNQTGA